jgi:hypothetical protein
LYLDNRLMLCRRECNHGPMVENSSNGHGL